MAITTLDTHHTVKEADRRRADGRPQAEAVTRALQRVQQIEAKLAEHKAELIRRVFVISIAQAATILAILKLFPSVHP